jgi:CRP-like cAMP-binding protein
MATSPVFISTQALEDPLAYLPRSTILTYKKDQMIYSPDKSAAKVYLIIGGKVKVYRIAENGREVLADVYRPDEFFGNSALIGSYDSGEKAIAAEPSTTVMGWTSDEIKELMLQRPRLGVALLQALAQRCVHFGSRLASFSSEAVGPRLARALIYFADRLGQPVEDGAIEMMPFSHKMLAQYVGTTRECITEHMNKFRRGGLLRYSRQGIALYPAAIRESLQR